MSRGEKYRFPFHAASRWPIRPSVRPCIRRGKLWNSIVVERRWRTRRLNISICSASPTSVLTACPAERNGLRMTIVDNTQVLRMFGSFYLLLHKNVHKGGCVDSRQKLHRSQSSTKLYSTVFIYFLLWYEYSICSSQLYNYNWLQSVNRLWVECVLVRFSFS